MGKRKISFGDPKYEDFTTHKNPKRRENYISRHSPAWMSRFILWEKPTLKGAIDNANEKYKDIKFKYKK